ncbi:VCBS repeat-containing protein [Arenibacter sp. GZD96]|uniref:VCBS repeat-containing protein n=1 Tax=Aurantibrevibacter litoralis TaxID=3106030 RepID=UPI002AFF5CE8|nr:VCBS repeat-containing protein [Arenibacter sp. GZD-96]MEA1784817.1 VCBS repeat-containing protein [Arenibacter sp. GZD-96]
MAGTRHFFALLAMPFLLLSCAKVDDSTLFSLLPSSQTNVHFKNILKETEAFNVLEYGYLYNGGGVAIGDLNNDGLPDIYFTGNMVGSHLYINKGNFKFEEIAKEAGVFAEGLWNTGTTMADVNGDGFLDIYVCRSAAPDPNKRKNLLFINNGDLTFTEQGAKYGIDDSGYSTQAAFFDYDRDGDLDLYVLNHSTQEYAGFGQISEQLKNRKNPAYSDKFYKNENGTYVEVGENIGLITNVLGFGLGIAISDINNDGWPDIYISNDYNEQDYLYINNTDGTFSERLQDYIGHTPLYSMGSDIADINNDGFTDMMLLDMLPEDNYRQKMVSGPDNYEKFSRLAASGFYNQTMRNMLQLNNQGTSFSEIGQFSGVSNTDWSWASLFADFDNDGFKDLFITNGYKRDYTNMDFINYAVQEKINENKTGKATAIMQLLEKMPSSVVQNYAYKNNKDLTFQKVNTEWGLHQKSLSNGAAYADLDNDGDLDLVVNNIDEKAFIYRNNSEKLSQNHFVKLNLKGTGNNTFGIGSKIQIFTSNATFTQELMPVRGYQSSVDYTLVFGLGAQKKIDSLKITWPDGKEQVLLHIATNQTLTLFQKEAAMPNIETGIAELPYFLKDSLLLHNHIENNFNDFQRERLLPHKLSTQGPKIAKGDIDGDGLEDFFIGGAKGYEGTVFKQLKSGRFVAMPQVAFIEDRHSEDIDALFFDADNDGDLDLYVVSGGNEFDLDDPLLQDRLYLNNGKGKFKKSVGQIPQMYTSTSCVTAADYDNDDDLDLFIGGRLVPGAYPTIPRSYLLENDGKGNFSDITKIVNPALEFIGMVTDATFVDINNDEKQDLILVGEWMPIRVFLNQGNVFTEPTGATGLENSNGWWNTIMASDMDNDGDIDFVIGNHGRNSQLKASPSEPVRLFVKDFDNNGTLDPIMCSYIMGEEYPVFSKDDLVDQLSMLKTRYVNYSDYADQKITDIFSAEELKDVTVFEATTFDSSFVENLGDGTFKITPLPASAQFAPIYGILAHDMNEDGFKDLILGGNFFGSRVKYGRYDANKGLFLIGDGKGGFTTVSQKASGLNLQTETRDLALIELPDTTKIILCAQNNAPMVAYKVLHPKKN